MDNFKLYTDKNEIFECNISITGGTLNSTKVRMILNFDDKFDNSIVCYGNILENKKCKITLPPLKNIISKTGNAVLEVISDNTYFESWNSKFNIEKSKDVVVESVTIGSKESTNTKVEINIESKKEKVKEPIKEVKKNIKSIDILNENIKERDKDRILKYIEQYKKIVSKKETKEKLEESLKNFEPSVVSHVWSKNIFTEEYRNKKDNMILVYQFFYDKEKLKK